MSEGLVKKINVPGSDVYLIDANKDGKFTPCGCEKGKPNTQCDYYMVSDKPACPDSDPIKDALTKIGITKLFGETDKLYKLMMACETLKNGEGDKIRVKAVFMLDELGDKSVVPALQDALKNDKSDEVRANAAEILGKLGDKSVVPALQDALKNDSDWFVRRQAAKALGKLGGETAKSALQIALKNEKNDDVLCAIEQAIKQLEETPVK